MQPYVPEDEFDRGEYMAARSILGKLVEAGTGWEVSMTLEPHPQAVAQALRDIADEIVENYIPTPASPTI